MPTFPGNLIATSHCPLVSVPTEEVIQLLGEEPPLSLGIESPAAVGNNTYLTVGGGRRGSPR